MGNILKDKKNLTPKNFTHSEFKTYVSLVEIKIGQQKNKKVREISNKRKEIAKSLMNNQLDIAKLKMDNIIHEENFIIALDILSTLIEILKEKVVYLLGYDKCPEDMRSTLDTIIYCSNRMDISELTKIREGITIKYGILYVTNASNNNDKLVNLAIIDKLSVKPNPNFLLITRLKQIALEDKIDYFFPPDYDVGNDSMIHGGNDNFFPGGSSMDRPQEMQGGYDPAQQVQYSNLGTQNDQSNCFNSNFQAPNQVINPSFNTSQPQFSQSALQQRPLGHFEYSQMPNVGQLGNYQQSQIINNPHQQNQQPNLGQYIPIVNESKNIPNQIDQSYKFNPINPSVQIPQTQGIPNNPYSNSYQQFNYNNPQNLVSSNEINKGGFADQQGYNPSNPNISYIPYNANQSQINPNFEINSNSKLQNVSQIPQQISHVSNQNTFGNPQPQFGINTEIIQQNSNYQQSQFQFKPNEFMYNPSVKPNHQVFAESKVDPVIESNNFQKYESSNVFLDNQSKFLQQSSNNNNNDFQLLGSCNYNQEVKAPQNNFPVPNNNQQHQSFSYQNYKNYEAPQSNDVMAQSVIVPNKLGELNYKPPEFEDPYTKQIGSSLNFFKNDDGLGRGPPNFDPNDLP